ncbi:MAG TPA: PfkB family carbohydrate kinase, partial [Anaerolineae bacterium]
MSPPARICVVGSSNIDLISKVPRLPRLGETLVGHSFHLGYGGKGANQAVMAAKLGASVAMVTKLGGDVFGKGTLENYRAMGIDTTFVLFDEKQASGVAPIFVDDSAQNFIVIIPGANDALSPSDARAAARVIRSAAVLICQLEIPLETTLEAFRIARAGNVRTILNPAPAVPLPDELLQITDICVPNETEIELLTGSPVQSMSEAEAAARQLLARGVGVVIVTLGERGALLVQPDTVEHFPSI